jgi:hypothetical protein
LIGALSKPQSPNIYFTKAVTKSLSPKIWFLLAAVQPWRKYAQKKQLLGIYREKLELPTALDSSARNSLPIRRNRIMPEKYPVKKWLAIFPSPAGMSLTKLSLVGNNLFT